MSKLLPCPFCGSPANLRGGGMSHEPYSVWCQGVSKHSLGGLGYDEATAIDAWNTRSDVAQAIISNAREDALREAAAICTGDEERPEPLSAATLRRMTVQEQFAHEQKRLAWKDADEILALIDRTAEDTSHD